MIERQPETDGSADITNETIPLHKRQIPRLLGALTAGALASGVATYFVTKEISSLPKDQVAVAGIVVCPKGEAVTGVWVEPEGGPGRGWARWSASIEHPHAATYSKSINTTATSYEVNVGCGGTPENWLHNDRSPEIPNTPKLVTVTCTAPEDVKFGTCEVTP